MTEQREQYSTDTQVSLRLPDEFEQRLDALADDPICPRWYGIAMVCEDAIKAMGKRSKMLVYHRVADKYSQGVPTIRLWTKYRKELGDFFDEMPYVPAWTQVRLAYRESKARNISVEEVLTQKYTESDKYGGQMCPYRVWSAQLKNEPDERNPVIVKLERLSSCAATALKAVSGNGFAKLSERLEALSNEADAILNYAEMKLQDNRAHADGSAGTWTETKEG